jgi:hypothetical protein
VFGRFIHAGKQHYRHWNGRLLVIDDH